MINAFYISDPLELKHFFNAHFGWIYFGAEFCSRFLPTAEQLQRVMAFARTQGAGFSLVTPPCTDADLLCLEHLLDILPAGTEVIFNDWGVYTLCAARGLLPVHGRLLNKVKKDPRIHLHHKAALYFKSCNLTPAYQQWLAACNIGRVELDNVLQGRALSLCTGLVSSLYYPYVPCSIGRHCVFCREDPVQDCAFACLGKILRCTLGGKELYVAGNVQFYTNPSRPDLEKAWQVDRLVYMPRFPQGNRFSADAFYLDWEQPFIRYREYEWESAQCDAVLGSLYRKLNLPGVSNILDIGCGNGRNSVLFPGSSYYGLDISAKAIALCREKFPGARFFQADITEFNGYSSHFHLAVDFGCLHTLPPDRHVCYFRSLAQLLKPGGYALLVTWKAEQNALPYYFCYDQLPEWGFEAGSITGLCSNAFELCETHTRQTAGDKALNYFLLRRKGILEE